MAELVYARDSKSRLARDGGSSPLSGTNPYMSSKIIFSKKVVERDYEDIFYKVLEKFPELDNICILVKKVPFHGIQHTLRAYAPILSLVNPKRRRVYPIVINGNKDTPVLFNDLTDEEKIGAMAHEFGHTFEYIQLSSIKIVRLTLLFLVSEKFVKKFERRADMVAIERGFGKELLLFKKRVFQENKIKLSGYRNFMYMSPDEVERILKNEQVFRDEKISIRLYRNIVWYSLFHKLKSFYSFFPSIWQMIVLIYFRRVHKTGHF